MNHWFFGEILRTFFSVQYVGGVKRVNIKTCFTLIGVTFIEGALQSIPVMSDI